MNTVLIAPLGVIVPADAIRAAVLRVESYDEFKFTRTSVSANPDVQHNNVTEIVLRLHVASEYRSFFEKIDPKMIIEAAKPEAEEEEEEKPARGRRARRAAVEKPVETFEMIEIDCGSVIPKIERTVSVTPLRESEVLSRAQDEFQKKYEKIENVVDSIEATVTRIAGLQQALQAGLSVPTLDNGLSDLVPQVGGELAALNQAAVERQEHRVSEEITRLRNSYDQKLDALEANVFKRVEDMEEYPATVETFEMLDLAEYREVKKIVSIMRGAVVAL